MTEPPLKKVVSARIKALRLELGLTQEQLCERAKISVDAVNRIESGRRVPTLATLEKVAPALGSSVSDLFRQGSSGPTKIAAPIRRLVTLVEKESEPVQETIEELVRTALKLAKTGRRKVR